MASSYTTNLRLTKQGDGENPNSWGQILNDGVISLADTAIAGYTQVSVGSTVSVALTQNQGSSDQSRSAFLEFTGSLGTAHTSIFVLIPNNSKGYVVRNSVSYATNANALIMRVAGNTGVTIPSGTNKHIITDGTSIYEISQDSFTNLTVEGNVTVEGNMVVSGAATFNTNVSVSGNIAGKGTLNITKGLVVAASSGTAVCVQGALFVSAASQFTGAIIAKSNVTVSGNVNIAGNTSIGGTATVGGAFVAGGAAQLQSTVTAVGAATFKSDVSVSGNTRIGGTVTIAGAVSLASTLSVAGATNFASTVTVVGAGTFKSAVSVSGNVNIAGNTSIGGTVTISGANLAAPNAKVCASAYYGDGSNLTGAMPTGAILPYGSSVAPSGYVLCNGTAYNRTGTYADLFGVIGVKYGVGDGSSTFNVPDTRGRFLAGWDAGTGVLTSVTVSMITGATIGNTGGTQAVALAVAQIPSHQHLAWISGSGDDEGVQANSSQLGLESNFAANSTVSTGSTGGSGSHSNIPPSLIINYIIKT